MKRFKRNIRQGCMLLSVFCLMGVTACSGEEGRDMHLVKPVAFTLNYTIPDADNPEQGQPIQEGKYLWPVRRKV